MCNLITAPALTHTPLITTPIVLPHIAMATDIIVLTITLLALILLVGIPLLTTITITTTVILYMIGIINPLSLKPSLPVVNFLYHLGELSSLVVNFLHHYLSPSESPEPEKIALAVW